MLFAMIKSSGGIFIAVIVSTMMFISDILFRALILLTIIAEWLFESKIICNMMEKTCTVIIPIFAQE